MLSILDNVRVEGRTYLNSSSSC